MEKINFNVNNLIISISLILFAQFLCANAKFEVIHAINAGGGEHLESKTRIRYQADPLKTGTASDFGKNLLMISGVSQAEDEILYQTERYHTGTFGYDIPLSGDGEYLLILKFCEVYFNEPNMKVFDVVLNGDHTIISDLDIFHNVGKGTAYDDYIYFTINHNRLYYKEEESEIRGNKIRIEFIKGLKDNPKINAFALLKGHIDELQKLQPISRNKNDESPLSSPPPQQPGIESEIPLNDDDLIDKPAKTRKTSGPKQPNPYSMDSNSMLLPVFVAIGAFLPILFCLCKL